MVPGRALPLRQEARGIVPQRSKIGRTHEHGKTARRVIPLARAGRARDKRGCHGRPQ
jgi:hypothetical protein